MTTEALPEPRAAGDGEWFYECNRDGCSWYVCGFSEAEARRLGDQHVEETHGIV